MFMELIGKFKLKSKIDLVAFKGRHLEYFVAKTVKLSLLATWRPCRVSPDFLLSDLHVSYGVWDRHNIDMDVCE